MPEHLKKDVTRTLWQMWLPGCGVYFLARLLGAGTGKMAENLRLLHRVGGGHPLWCRGISVSDPRRRGQSPRFTDFANSEGNPLGLYEAPSA